MLIVHLRASMTKIYHCGRHTRKSNNHIKSEIDASRTALLTKVIINKNDNYIMEKKKANIMLFSKGQCWIDLRLRTVQSKSQKNSILQERALYVHTKVSSNF